MVQRHQGWRLVTCIWLHAGVIHLVANMLSLIFIGIRLEQQFGFGMLSVLCAVNPKPCIVVFNVLGFSHFVILYLTLSSLLQL